MNLSQESMIKNYSEGGVYPEGGGKGGKSPPINVNGGVLWGSVDGFSCWVPP